MFQNTNTSCEVTVASPVKRQKSGLHSFQRINSWKFLAPCKRPKIPDNGMLCGRHASTAPSGVPRQSAPTQPLSSRGNSFLTNHEWCN